MGKSEKRKAPEPDTVLEHGNGTILKVRVTNFMCHQHLEVELGPRINFIVGENGSGKSAVLTALMVCLGTKKGAKERSDKGLKGFIREGSNFAKVEVSIRNVGNDAFEPQMNHGDVITVERTISASGSGSFKIRNKAGKEIGSSREMLLRMMDHFNIDVDNPIVVMTQDSSRQFLHSGKDTDKYKFFVKATLLEDIQVKLQWIKEQVKEMDALIEAKEQELPTLQTNVENLEKEAESFQKMEEFVKEQEQWRNRLAWSEVYKVEKDMAELEVELDSYRGTHTTELAQQRRKTEEQLEQSKTNLAEVKARLTECTEKTSQAKNDLEAAKAKRAQLAGQAKREDTSILSHNNEIRSMEQEKEMLEKELEESRALMQQQSQAQDISLQRAVDAAREHRDKLKREMDAAVANAHELPRKKRDAEGEKMRAESAIREADQNFRNCENSLKEARNERGGILVKFGQNMPKLAEALKKHAAQFEKPPLGPIGVYVKLKDQNWARAVEQHVGPSLNHFLVSSMKDRSTLDQLMRSCGVPPNITVVNYNRGKYTIEEHRLPPSSLTKMLDVLEFDNPVVHNFIIDRTQAELSILVPDEEQAKDIVRNKQMYPNVKEAFTLGDRIINQMKGTNVDRGFKLGLVPRLAADKKQLVAQLTAQMQQAKKDQALAREQLKAKAAACAALNKQENDAYRKKTDAQVRLRKAEEDLEEANSALAERAGGAATNVFDLQENVARIVEKLEGPLKEKSEQLRETLAAAKEAHAVANDEVNALMKGNEELTRESDQIAETYEAAVNEWKQEKANLEWWKSKEKELEERIAETESSVAGLRLVIEHNTEEALAVCTRETARSYLDEDEAEKSPEALRKEYDRATRRVENESKRHARPQHIVLKELKNTKASFSRLQRTLENSRDPCNNLRKGHKLRQKMLKHSAESVEKQTSHRFNHYLSKKGGAGKVTVDYKTSELRLNVQLAGQEGNKVKDTRSLSGGERSFTTLSLTLSIGETIESPFRAMDEFDVFMDAVNRKISMDALIHFARDPLNLDKQFLFITPQDISAVDASAVDIRVQKMKAARPT
jgi:chromosome segregation ATPase